MEFVIDDGGRSPYFKGKTADDCVTRSIAIASGCDYRVVYDRLAAGHHTKTGKRSARDGIITKHKWFKDYMCLRDGELPTGRLVVSLSRHYTAVLDGVIHDTHDPQRNGTRCVYGYWEFKGE